MFTNRDFAARIVLYFNPVGRVLDPCRGPGAFYEAMPAGSDWCEITEGRDFLAHAGCCDWIITDPPWSRAYRDIAKRAFEIADNVVFLVRFDTALGTSARLNDAQDHGHAVKEVIDVSWRDAEFIVHGHGWSLSIGNAVGPVALPRANGGNLLIWKMGHLNRRSLLCLNRPDLIQRRDRS